MGRWLQQARRWVTGLRLPFQFDPSSEATGRLALIVNAMVACLARGWRLTMLLRDAGIRFWRQFQNRYCSVPDRGLGRAGAVPALLFVWPIVGVLVVVVIHVAATETARDASLPLTDPNWQSYDVGAAQIRDSDFFLDIERADAEARELRYSEVWASFFRESMRFYHDSKLAQWEIDAKYALAQVIAWRSATSGFTKPGFGGGVGSGYCSVDYLATFFGSNAGAAASVCMCESGGNPNAQNASGAHGLFQLMPQFHGYHWSPAANASYAAMLSNGGRNWSAWVCKP